MAAPTGSDVSSVQTILTGHCASGWNTCAQNVGGGCCPTGYACGQACTATMPEGRNNTVGKISPNAAIQHDWSSWTLIGTALAVLGSIL